jgi:hypothetical protein
MWLAEARLTKQHKTLSLSLSLSLSLFWWTCKAKATLQKAMRICKFKSLPELHRTQKLAIYCCTSRSRIFLLYGDITIAREGLENLNECSALRAFEQAGLSIGHTCCDTWPWFFRSHPILFLYLFIAPRAIFQLSGGCHHYWWQGCKFRPKLST